MDAYTHVMFATDLTEENRHLAARAQDLASRYGAKLSLVHVVEYSPLLEYGNGQIFPTGLELEETLAERARETLRRWGGELGVAGEDQWVEIGATKTEVLRVAKERGVDLIVVGSHGRHGLGLLLGSTANAVLHGAPCDVLALRVHPS
jgi:universal stress protein A